MAGTATADQQRTETAEQSDDQGTKPGAQSTDQAGADDAGVEEQEVDESTEGETEEEDAVELIGQTEFDKLKADPEALRKELNRAATKKFQSLSADRKALEPYKGFIAGLVKDPVAAITAVARQLGIKIDGKATSTEAATEKTVQSLAEKITESVKKSLGPDYEDLAASMGTAIHDALQIAVPELTKSSEQKVNQIIQDSAMRESAAAIAAFEKEYPDWKKHETAMTELSESMPPGPGISEAQYLKNLYLLVTQDRAAGEGVKKVLKRMQRSAEAAGDKTTTIQDKSVSRSPSKPPTFAEAYEAAKRNERIE